MNHDDKQPIGSSLDGELRDLIADQEWTGAGVRAEIEDKFRKAGIPAELVGSIMLGQYDVTAEEPEPEWQIRTHGGAVWDVTNVMLDDFDCFVRGAIEDLLPDILEKTGQSDTPEARIQTVDEAMVIFRESGTLFAKSSEQWRKDWEMARELRSVIREG